jgi:hypothetical protein
MTDVNNNGTIYVDVVAPTVPIRRIHSILGLSVPDPDSPFFSTTTATNNINKTFFLHLLPVFQRNYH